MFVAALCGRDNASCHSPRQERTSGLRPRPEVEAGALSFGGGGKSMILTFGVWRYVRPFVRNNNYSACNCNCIGGFARDDSLPQHLAAASRTEPAPLLAQHASSVPTCLR